MKPLRSPALAAFMAVATITFSAEQGLRKSEQPTAPSPPATDSTKDVGDVEKTVRDLAALGSRIPGYRGSAAAEEYVFRAFQEIGLEDVRYEPFDVGAPIDEGASIEIGGEKLPLRCLWPNALRTPTLPEGGINGPLLYGGDGSWRALEGKELSGAVVLLDFESGTNWLHVFELGGRAVIFLAPETTTRQEAELKFGSAPINAPRFWADANVAKQLQGLTKSGASPPVAVTARMCWRNARARNVLARIEGSDEKALREHRATQNSETAKREGEPMIAYVVVSAYFDSISVAPTQAPGAENASSIAGLLEAAKNLKAHPPRRSVIFLATNAHFLGMNGIGTFVREYELAMRREKEKKFESVGEIPPDVARRLLCEQFFKPFFPNFWAKDAKSRTFFIGLDLSSHSRVLGVFARGSYEDQHDIYRTRSYMQVGRSFKEAARAVLGREDVTDTFADTINPTQGKDADSFFPRLPAFESEIANFQMPGVTLATCSDNRERVDTPFDTPERVQFENLRLQTEFLGPLLARTIDDPDFPMEMKEEDRPKKLIFGRTVEFDPRKSFVPEQPVANTVLMAVREHPWSWSGAFLKSYPKPLYGVHINNVTVADAQGKFAFMGLQWRERIQLEAAAFEPQTGEILYAPDRGVEGDEKYHFRGFAVADQGGKPLNYVLFRCVPISIVDFIDPRYLVTLINLNLIDSDTENKPHAHGFALPQMARYDSTHVESTAVLFLKPRTKLKLTMGLGWTGNRLVLLNITDKKEEGEGFRVEQPMVFRHAKAQVAKDLWNLDDGRIKKLTRYGIRSARLDETHAEALSALQASERAVTARQWGKADEQAERAWALESSIYYDVVGTANDVVKGVLFYLALVVPFAYFLERLLFAFGNIYRQIQAVSIIFVAVLGILILVHPAFSITLTPFLIFLAFVIMALAGLVIAIVMLRFNAEVKALRGGRMGVHGADVNRLAAVGAALSLGIGNMRRRKIRTATTCATVILLTFTVLSFTSMKTYVHYNIYELPWKAGFEGVFFRNLAWWSLQGTLLDRFQSEMGEKFYLAPRSWYISSNISEALVIEARNARALTRFTQLDALVGLSEHEPRISKVDQTLLTGRWFRADDLQACIISQATAQVLGISADDVASGKAAVALFGAPMTVLGIFDAEKADQLKGITNEPLTPVNFQILRPSGRANQESDDPTAALAEKYIYFPSQSCLFVPHAWLVNNGGTLRAIAATPKEKVDLQSFLRDLMQRWAIILTAGIPDKEGHLQALLFSSRGSTAVGVDVGLLPTLLIGFLIVFSTMMGSVYERLKEISIYSSVGLSPLHISMLFIAEAAVYATIGSIAGYLLGQIISKILLHFGLLGGLTLNYSSSSALFSILLVIAVVLLSALYPAYKAMRLAVPDIEATWSLGEPVGDKWQFRLPFQVRSELAMPMCEFMAQFFEIHSEQAIGAFSTEGVRMELRGPDGYGVYFKCWLAPYDFGISQQVALETVPTDDGVSYEFRLRVTRLSGDIESWKRANGRFLNLIRKQFLIWRTVRDDARERYAEQAQTRVGKDLLAQAQTIVRSPIR